MYRGHTLCVDPFCVEVRYRGLVAELLQRLRGLFVDKTTATSPPGLFCFEGHLGACGRGQLVRGPRIASKAQAAVEDYGRQLGGIAGLADGDAGGAGGGVR